MHSFLDRVDRSENKPEKADDPPGVKNGGERAGPKNPGWPGSDPGDNGHEGKAAAGHPQKKRGWLADRGCAEGQPRLLILRIDLTSAPPNDRKHPNREKRKQSD